MAFLVISYVTYVKVEYHVNENPLKNSEKSICWSKVDVSNNHEKIIPYHAIFVLNAIKCLGLYIKNGSF